MTDHKTIAAAEVHVPGYLQSSDPGAVGAGKYWIDTTAGAGLWVLKARNAANTGWETVGGGGGGGGAPTGADYLVGTANAGLSAEIVVGATPGGELGGTWPSPTVDTTHSGSSHAGVISTHEAAGDPHPVYQTSAEAIANAVDAITAHNASADPHTGYRRESEDHSHASTGLQAGTVAHSALTGLTTGDPHTQYQQESEKGAASGYASLDSGVLVPVAQLGTGTPTGSKFLRDDRTWQVPAGGGGSLTDHTHEVTGSGATGGGGTVKPATLVVPTGGPPATAGALGYNSTDESLYIANGFGYFSIHKADNTAPTTAAFGDTAASGSVNRTAKRDHVHGMPANPVVGMVQTINFVIDGGGADISTGIKGDLVIDFACTITKWTVLADASGSIAVAVWKDAYAGYPPASGDLVVTPTITSAMKAQSGAISHAIAAGDVLRYNVNSSSGIYRATVALTVTRT